jgi:hypothetical protein
VRSVSAATRLPQAIAPPHSREPPGPVRRPAGMDDIEREALRSEGLNPDDPAVIAAIDVVRWELSLYDNWAASGLPLIH